MTVESGFNPAELPRISPETLGVVPVREAVQPDNSPAAGESTSVQLYSLEGLVRQLADERGIFDVSSMATFLTGDDSMPEGDINVLNQEISALAKSSTDIRQIGKGLFAIFSETNNNGPIMGTKGNLKVRRGLETMMRNTLGPPKPYLPKDPCARQREIQKWRRTQKKK